MYSASFAAVPHVVAAIASNPEKTSSSYFQFPAWVEICRQHQDTPVPEDLKQAYFDALGQLPALAAAAASRPWGNDMVACVLAAIAIVKGNVSVAEAALELSPEGAASYLQWLADQ